MPLVKFGEYLPDQPDYQNPGSNNIRNCLPVTPDSYGPMYNLMPFTGALGARCQGGMFVRDSSGNLNAFAGTASKLYNLPSGNTSWSDVSLGGGYTVSADQNWQFAAFDQRVIACQFGNAIQTFLMGTDVAFSNLSASAPTARYVAVARDFVVVANTTDGTYGARPQRVWWSAIGDATSWPTPGTTAAAQVQSDYQDLLGEGGWNQGIVGGLAGADLGIFQERRIWRGSYVGSPAIFSFTLADAARGCPAPGSIVQAGGVAFYLSDMGFFAFDGIQSVPIGDQKVDQTFWADVDTNYLYRICAAADPLNKIVMWAYPGAGNTGGTPNRILAYHYAIQKWTLIDTIQLEWLTKGATGGYTLDQLYTSLGYSLDNLPYPLDSRAWTGGRLTLGAFDTSHKFGFFSGASLAATLETSETQLNENGQAFVNRVWPMVDTANAQIAIGYRNRLADSPTYTPATGVTSTSGSAGVRATGFFHRARVTVPAADTWSHAQGVQFDFRSAGSR